jgi:hypothetical protein
MARLSSQGQESAPLSETGDQILELTAQELATKRDAGQLEDIVSLVNRWYTYCKNARSMEERQWFKNIDMVQGRQFTIWDINQKRMVNIPNLDYNVRLSVNITEPIVRTEITKTGKNQPIPTVSPASNDLSDLMAAESAEAAVEWWYSDQKFQTHVFTPANWWRSVTGIGFWKTYWDPSVEDIAAVDAARQQAAAEAAQQQAQLAGNVSPMFPGQPLAGPAAPPPVTPDVRPGRVVAEHVTPFHIFIPDMAQLDLQRQPYLIHAYTVPVEKARLMYADRLPQDWSPSPIGSNTIVDLSRLGILGANASQPDQVLVLECFVKPGYSLSFPKGGFVVMCADEVVHLSTEGMPYSHGEYPFAMITSIENGKFYRKSVVESITPLQNELNQTVSQIVKRKNIASAPQMFYDEGSVDPRRITNKPGQWIPVRLGMNRPSPVPVTETPAYVLDLLNRIRQFLDDISGQHDVSRASAPGADTAASALQLLQEADDDFLSTTFASIDAAMEVTGRQFLQLAVQFWDQERLVKVTGRENAFDVRLLTGSDLKNGTDLRVEVGSSLPLSKTAKIATITDWMDKGYVPAEVGLSVLEMGSLGRLYRQLRIDQDQANRENIEMRDFDTAAAQQHFAEVDAQAQAQQQMQQQMAAVQQSQPQQVDPATGQPVQPPAPPQAPQAPPLYPIGWQDNDQIHMKQHADFAKGQTYKNLPPEIQRIFEEHYYAHMDRANQLGMVAAQIHGEELGATMKAEGLQPGLYANTQRDAIDLAS